MSNRARILLVDDDPQSLESTRKILELSGYEVVTAVDGQAALDLVRPSAGRLNLSAELPIPFDLVVTDVRMPRLGGLEFLRALSLCGETVPVVLMTAFGRVEDAVWAMKLGAVDFLTKPFKRQTLISSVEGALKRARKVPEAAPAGRASAVSGAPEAEPSRNAFVGNSPQIVELRDLIRQVAPTAASVLVVGESGTGKELVARQIHEQSARAKMPFIGLNCAAFPEPLIESELFGYEKGAFTGAQSAKAGLFEAASGGTVLLDEIGDMPLALQAKLLRVLQESEVRRVGSTVSRKVDIRLIAATHRDLRESVKAGSFRQDLLYRLEVVTLSTPSLRDRAEDIPDLAYHFLRSAAAKHGKKVEGIEEAALELLLGHSWPGNVRELSNVTERAVIFCKDGIVRATDLPSHLQRPVSAGSVSATTQRLASGAISIPLGTSLKDAEDLLIRKTLEATSGDKNMTAKLLGINSRTIYRRLDEAKRDESDTAE